MAEETIKSSVPGKLLLAAILGDKQPPRFKPSRPVTVEERDAREEEARRKRPLLFRAALF